MMLDTMDEITYAFYLAYGMTQKMRSWTHCLDVEMYNILGTESSASFEACDSSVLFRDTSEAKTTRVEF